MSQMFWRFLIGSLIMFLASPAMARVDLKHEFAHVEKPLWPQNLNSRLRNLEKSQQLSKADWQHLGEVLLAIAPHRWEFFNQHDLIECYFLVFRIHDAHLAELDDSSFRRRVFESFQNLVKGIVFAAKDYATTYDEVAQTLEEPENWLASQSQENWHERRKLGYPTRNELSTYVSYSTPEGRDKLHELKELKAKFESQMELLASIYVADPDAASRNESVLYLSAVVGVAYAVDEGFLRFLSAPDFGYQSYVDGIVNVRRLQGISCEDGLGRKKKRPK